MDLLAGLNPQQRAAVEAGNGPVIVYAGPGSGKTRVLTHRIAYLVKDQGVYPGAIMAVTFTNKAASEMRQRAESLLDNRLRGLQIGTFHAICARILRRETEQLPYRSDYVIYDTDDQLSVVGQAMRELNIDSKRYTPRRVLGAISNAKNELVTAAEFQARDYFNEIVARVYPLYQEILVANNAMDFDDLLMQTVLLLRDNRGHRREIRQILRARAGGRVPGHQHGPVQAGADVRPAAEQHLRRRRRGPGHLCLSWGRLPQRAQLPPGLPRRADDPAGAELPLDADRAGCGAGGHRQESAPAAESPVHRPRQAARRVFLYEAYDENEEGEFAAQKVEEIRHHQRRTYRDFAVMYRTNAQSRAMEAAFVEQNIPYKLVGGVGFYKRREVRDVLAYLRLVNNPDDSVSFERIINVPKRGIGKKSLADFQGWAAQETDVHWRGADGPAGRHGDLAFEPGAEQFRRLRRDAARLAGDCRAGRSGRTLRPHDAQYQLPPLSARDQRPPGADHRARGEPARTARAARTGADAGDSRWAISWPIRRWWPMSIRWTRTPTPSRC